LFSNKKIPVVPQQRRKSSEKLIFANNLVSKMKRRESNAHFAIGSPHLGPDDKLYKSLNLDTSTHLSRRGSAQGSR
jgi:hypothetical protein